MRRALNGGMQAKPSQVATLITTTMLKVSPVLTRADRNHNTPAATEKVAAA